MTETAWNAREYKKPGMTLAESLGLEIPDDAPGGRPIPQCSPSIPGNGQNRLNIEYDGFYDLDAYRRDHG